MIKKFIKKITGEATEFDNTLSNNYKSKDVNAEIARDNYQLYQKELVQREQGYIEKWCEQIKTDSRKGKKYIYTNNFLVLDDGNKIAFIFDDDGYC